MCLGQNLVMHDSLPRFCCRSGRLRAGRSGRFRAPDRQAMCMATAPAFHVEVAGNCTAGVQPKANLFGKSGLNREFQEANRKRCSVF